MPPTNISNNIPSQHGFLSVIDYATAGPYVNVDVRSIDVAVFSPHKFLGGPGGSGVLCIKKHLVSQSAPVTQNGGGGTVFYVTQETHKFTTNRIERWEGRTPDVIGCVRAGMAFMVKRMGGVNEKAEGEEGRRANAASAASCIMRRAK